MKVFWSWQSDVYPSECRAFVKSALVDAIAVVGKDLDVTDAERPEIDHDTKGVAGMADIAEEILKKIEASAVFVADVTPISKLGDKLIPNPNVLVELGFAMAKPGFDKIIAVLNTADGAKIEGLPFDIRKRRVMTYHLPVGADSATRAGQRRALVAALSEALKTNLQSHLDQAAGETPIAGSASKVGDPSLWESCSGAVVCYDGSSSLRHPKATIPGGARAYSRIIPASWPNGPPTVDEVANVPDQEAVWPVTTDGIGSGSDGPCPEGYVRYWLTRKNADGTYESANVSMYLDDPGEYWIIYGGAIKDGPNNTRVFYAEPTLAAWSKSVRRALGVMDRFNAHPLSRVEVGVVGLDGARWPGVYPFNDAPVARKPKFVFARQQRTWNADARLEFLLSAYDGVRNVFAMPRVSPSNLRQLLDQLDPGWEKGP